MNILPHYKRFVLAVMVAFGTLTVSAWAVAATAFSNTGSIANTRHNMTQSTASVSIDNIMDTSRNNYNEVCVYCHTPHGANSTVTAPLWNRTIKATTYTVYNSASLTQTVSQPGNNSLACLTCHDGQTAIDSVVNMPGSGRYLASQVTNQNGAFLDTWNNVSGTDAVFHRGLNSIQFGATYIQGNGTGRDSVGCLSCHSPVFFDPDTGFVSGGSTDFTIFNLGTDLRNDHPVGVAFPAANGPGTDWNTPAGMVGSSIYFDTNSNSRMDKAEIRTYDGKVECASCHDPHGVPSAGPGSQFKPTFLRVSNAGSAVCLTCHAK